LNVARFMVFAVAPLNIRWDVTLCCWARMLQLFFMDCLTTILENIRKYAHYDARLESVVLGSRKI